ncbi:ABC transporter ATP-binding protein [Brachybacterium kimchii]|uniref:ABC transporter ATP-binding protein n=1 Tax=Brachybacterium kimchii TaxID=2942909 RepID=A0ABY4NBL9_9MICO|nr:ABC transporter ATP-binding protein [Brachybacterium kimchii]UQN31524.1 ABC transporter ATP-binding protein [Brachybacterium kimchii]
MRVEQTMVAIEGVSKSFRGAEVFNSASMDVLENRICGLQGPNGTGKSVLFKMIVGLQRPDSGDIKLDASLKSSHADFPTEVGAVIDRPAYLGGLTGMENLLDLARIRRVVSRDQVAEAMEKVGLNPGTQQKVRNYSLGMKQKLSIAQAFMEDQRLIILDEAFNGLDDSSVERIRSLLHELQEDGRTILLTSHNQGDIDAVCDDVWKIDQGQLHRVR